MNQASSAVPTETVSVPLKTIDKFRRASPVVVDGFRPYRSNTSILQEAGLAPVKGIFSLFHASCSRTRTFLAVSSCRLHFNRDRQKRGSCHAVQLQRFSRNRSHPPTPCQLTGGCATHPQRPTRSLLPAASDAHPRLSGQSIPIAIAAPQRLRRERKGRRSSRQVGTI